MAMRRSTKPKPSIEELREIFDYDHLTGLFRRKKSRDWRKPFNRDWTPGTIDNHGYYNLGINQVVRRSHILAFAIYHGRWPTDCIDHINGDKTDNRISNLRECTQQMNVRNSRRSKNSQMPVGVTEKNGRFMVRVFKDRKPIKVGVFTDIHIAAHEYNKAAIALYGDFARLNPLL